MGDIGQRHRGTQARIGKRLRQRPRLARFETTAAAEPAPDYVEGLRHAHRGFRRPSSTASSRDREARQPPSKKRQEPNCLRAAATVASLASVLRNDRARDARLRLLGSRQAASSVQMEGCPCRSIREQEVRGETSSEGVLGDGVRPRPRRAGKRGTIACRDADRPRRSPNQRTSATSGCQPRRRRRRSTGRRPPGRGSDSEPWRVAVRRAPFVPATAVLVLTKARPRNGNAVDASASGKRGALSTTSRRRRSVAAAVSSPRRRGLPSGSRASCTNDFRV